MLLHIYLFILPIIGITLRNPSCELNIIKSEFQLSSVLKSVSILKIKASTSNFCPKCGYRVFRVKCPCSYFKKKGLSGTGERSHPGRRKSSDHSKSSSDTNKELTNPIHKIKDPKIKLKLISEKHTQIQFFKSSIKEIKLSIDVSLLILITDCTILLTRQFSNLDSNNLKEELLELMSNFAGQRILDPIMPFFIKKEDLYTKQGVNNLTIEDLALILESCIYQAQIIINNLASIFDKKEKIREIKEDIAILRS